MNDYNPNDHDTTRAGWPGGMVIPNGQNGFTGNGSFRTPAARSSAMGGRQFAPKGPSVAMDIPGSTLRSMISKGDLNLRNAHEVPSSVARGRNYISDRVAIERDVLGVPVNAPASARPKYGYIPETKPGMFRPQTNVGGYGDTSLIFKKNINDRVTTTRGDSRSLASSGPVGVQPLIKGNPNLPSRKGAEDTHPGAYREAQIYGELGLQNVKKVLHPDINVARELQGLLRQQGIKVRAGRTHTGFTGLEKTVFNAKSKAVQALRNVRSRVSEFQRANERARYWKSPEGQQRKQMGETAWLKQQGDSGI